MRSPATYERLLVPTDLSDVSRDAVLFAYGLAPPGATVHLFHVREPIPVLSNAGLPLGDTGRPVRSTDERVEADLERRLARLAPKDARGRGVRTEIAIEASAFPARSIVERADALDVDAIVMGTHGRSGFERLLLGSVTAGVLDATKRPLIVFHAGGAPD